MVSAEASTIAVISTLPSEIVQGVVDRIAGYPDASSWSISNKYYTAHVSFRIASDAAQCENFPACVFVVDGFAPVAGIKDDLCRMQSRAHPDVCLVAALFGQQNASEQIIDAWETICVDHGFELVPVDVQQSPTDDVGGIARLQEALQLHPWPSQVVPGSAAQAKLPEKQTTFDNDFEPFQSAATDDVQLSPDLDRLYAQLQSLRAQAELISDPEERRQYAEKVALAFATGLETGDDTEPPHRSTP